MRYNLNKFVILTRNCSIFPHQYISNGDKYIVEKFINILQKTRTKSVLNDLEPGDYKYAMSIIPA